MAPALRKGSTGARVKELQQALIRVGYAVPVDGHFGNGTDQAVRSFQRSRGMLRDGVVGTQTFKVLSDCASPDGCLPAGGGVRFPPLQPPKGSRVSGWPHPSVGLFEFH